MQAENQKALLKGLYNHEGFKFFSQWIDENLEIELRKITDPSTPTELRERAAMRYSAFKELVDKVKGDNL